MNEELIAQKLSQAIAPPPAPVAAPPLEPEDTSNDGVGVAMPLDELTSYKLHQYFNEEYRDSDTETKTRAEFIYNTIASTLEQPEYGLVIAKARELERVLGITNADNRLYRLYQWLRLDETRRMIEREQGAVLA